jgi:hypothetical protein
MGPIVNTSFRALPLLAALLAAPAAAEPVEVFTIRAEPSGPGGVLRLLWDTSEFSVPFHVQ